MSCGWLFLKNFPSDPPEACLVRSMTNEKLEVEKYEKELEASPFF